VIVKTTCNANLFFSFFCAVPAHRFYFSLPVAKVGKTASSLAVLDTCGLDFEREYVSWDRHCKRPTKKESKQTELYSESDKELNLLLTFAEMAKISLAKHAPQAKNFIYFFIVDFIIAPFQIPFPIHTIIHAIFTRLNLRSNQNHHGLRL